MKCSLSKHQRPVSLKRFYTGHKLQSQLNILNIRQPNQSYAGTQSVEICLCLNKNIDFTLVQSTMISLMTKRDFIKEKQFCFNCFGTDIFKTGQVLLLAKNVIDLITISSSTKKAQSQLSYSKSSEDRRNNYYLREGHKLKTSNFTNSSSPSLSMVSTVLFPCGLF